MSHWNYRLFRVANEHPEFEGPYSFQFREVHYDDEGKPYGATQSPAEPWGSTYGEVVRCLKWMKRALRRPILEFDGNVIKAVTDLEENDSHPDLTEADRTFLLNQEGEDGPEPQG